MKTTGKLLLKSVSSFAFALVLVMAGALTLPGGVTTVWADSIGTNWSGAMTVNESITIDGTVKLSGNTEVSVAEGRILRVTGGIDCDGHTLTFVGPGSMTVNGKNGLNGEYIAEAHLGEGEVHAGSAVIGSLVVKGGTFEATGGEGGYCYSNQTDNIRVNGGDGGSGIKGNLQVDGGNVTIKGGNAKGGNDQGCSNGNPGHGVDGDLVVNGGTVSITGSHHVGGYSTGEGGIGVTGNSTIAGGSVTVTGGYADSYNGNVNSLCFGGSVTLSGGILEANQYDNTSGWGYGAFYEFAEPPVTVKIEGGAYTDGSATYASGIYLADAANEKFQNKLIYPVLYSVNIPESTCGTVECTGESFVIIGEKKFLPEETVTVTVTPAEGCQLKELWVTKTSDSATTVAVSDTGDAYTFIMPDYDVTVTAFFTVSTSYINSDGVRESVDAIPLTYEMEEIGGISSTSGTTWYVVNEVITLSHYLTLKGDVNIILADGKTMTIGSELGQVDGGCIVSEPDNDNKPTKTLSFYGQDEGTGKAVLYGDSGSGSGAVDVYGYGQYGGSVAIHNSNSAGIGLKTGAGVDIINKGLSTNCSLSVTSAGGHAIDAETAVTINNAKVTAETTGSSSAAIHCNSGSVAITDSKVTAEATGADGCGIWIDKTMSEAYVTLSLSGADDFVKASKYEANAVKVAAGKYLVDENDNTKVYGGKELTSLTDEQVSALAGKTLRPAYVVGIASSIEHGTVSVSKTAFRKYGFGNLSETEKTVTLDMTPNENYTIGTVSYNDGSDRTITPVNGVYSFTMPGQNVTVSATFLKSLSHSDITINGGAVIDDQTYTGSAITPDITVRDGATVLEARKDYTVSYRNNTNAALKDAGASAPAVIITGQGAYSGEVTMNFTISPKSITGATVTLSEVQQEYDGAEKSVSVSVQLDDTELAKGSDYEVTGTTGTDEGLYLVTVTGKGNYKDTATATWEIVRRDANTRTFIGTIDWRDGGGDHTAPPVLTLYRATGEVPENPAKGEPVTYVTPWWNGDNTIFTYSGLRVFADDGSPYSYWVIESKLDGYEAPQYHNTGTNPKNDRLEKGGKIINYIEQEKITITGTVTWEHGGNPESNRPKTVTVHLQGNGLDLPYKVITLDGTKDEGSEDVELDPDPNDENIWHFQFGGLDKYEGSTAAEHIYTVREDHVANYTTTYDDFRLNITNTYNTNTLGDILRVSKTVDVSEGQPGWTWDDNAKFVFGLFGVSNTAGVTQPMPSGAVYGDGVYKLIEVNKDSAEHEAGFGAVSFDTPGTYVYSVRELTPAESGTSLPGMTYDTEAYTVTVVVDKNMKLSAAVTDQAGKTIKSVDGESTLTGKTDSYVLPFTNHFAVNQVDYVMTAGNSYIDPSKLGGDGRPLDVIGEVNGKFGFTMKPVGDNAASAPMPSDGYNSVTGTGLQGEGADRVYYAKNVNGRVLFGADVALAISFIEEQAGTYSYELAEVIPDDAVYIGSGFWYNDADETVYDGVVHTLTLTAEKVDGVLTVTLSEAQSDTCLNPETGTKYKDAKNGARRDAAGIINSTVYPRRKNGVPLFSNYKDPKIDVTAKKVWDDADNQDGMRPGHVSFLIERIDGQPFIDVYGNILDSKVAIAVTDSANDPLEVVWSNLPRYKRRDDGIYEQITYKVFESANGESSRNSVPGYANQVITGDDEKGFTITNKHVPELRGVSVTMQWNDDNDRDGKRPEGVTFHLDQGKDGGSTQTDYQPSITVSSDNGWKATWLDLPARYGDSSKEFGYALRKEGIPDCYTAEDCVEGKASMQVRIPEGITPLTDKVVVWLTKDGSVTGDRIELSRAGSWTGTFEGVLTPSDTGDYSQYGVAIYGTDTGIDSGDLQKTIIRNYTITGTHTPEKRDLTVSKVWEMRKAGMVGVGQPDSVQVRLKANGKYLGEAVTLTDAENWQHTWSGLYVYEGGAPVDYTVEELNVPAYYTRSDEQSGDLYKITNTFNIDVTKAPAARSGLAYNGKAQALITAGEASNGTFRYALSQSADTAPADNLYSTSIPTATDAGTYYVWYRVEGDGNYNSLGAADPIEVTIEKRNLTIKADSVSKTYDGRPLTADTYAIDPDSNTSLAEGDAIKSVTVTGMITNVSDSPAANKPSDAVIVNGSIVDVTGNYAVTYLNGALTILKPETNAVTVAMEGWTYGDTPKTPVSVANYGTVSYTYGAEKEGEYTSEVPTTPGDWWVKASVEGTDNYPAGSQTMGFRIEPLAITLTAASAERVYNGQALTKQEYTVTGSLATDEAIDSVTFSESSTITDVGTQDNEITAAVIKKGEAVTTGCYAITFAKGTLTVTKAQTNDVTVSLDGWIIGDEGAHTPTCTADLGQDTVSYSYSDAENGEYTADQPTTAGTWWVKAVVPETNNYVGGEAKASFTIRKPASVVTKKPVAIGNLVYNGREQTLASAGTADGGDMRYALSSSSGSAPEAKDYSDKLPVGTLPGDYYVWYMVKGDDSHEDCVPENPITVNIAQVTITEVNLTVYDKVFDDTNLVPETSIHVDSLTGVLPADSDSVRFEISSATFLDKNVGTGKTVTIIGTLNGSKALCYKLLSNTVTATASITAKLMSENDANLSIVGTSVEYRGEAVAPGTVTITYAFSEDSTVTLTQGTDYDLSYSNNVNVGDEAVITATFTGNYTGTATAHFSITPATPVVNVPTLDEVTYDPAKKLSDITLSGGWTWETGTTVPTVGNSGYAAVLSVDDANYNYSGVDGYDSQAHTVTRTVTLTVNKATAPEVTVPTLDEVTYDPAKKLSDITLPGGWMWETGSTVPTVDNDGYAAALTVDDANYNYSGVDGYDSQANTVTRTVTLTVKPADSTSATVTANNRTYDRTEESLLNVDNSTLSGGEMQYALGTATGATQPYTTSIPSKTDAGTYYVWYKVVGDANHNDTQAANITVTISKATVTAPTIASKTYTGEAQTADVTESTLYSVTMNNGGTNVGSYDVVLTLTDSGNYKWTDSTEAAKTLSFQITKAAAPEVTVPTLTQ